MCLAKVKIKIPDTYTGKVKVICIRCLGIGLLQKIQVDFPRKASCDRAVLSVL